MRCASLIIVYTCPSQTGTCNNAKPATQVLSINTASTCAASDYVALTSQEWATQDSPFRLSLSEAGLIASAILLTWAVAFGIKALVKTIGSGDSES